MEGNQREAKQSKRKEEKEQAHAAVTKESSDSSSDSCAFLHDIPECSIDWNDIMASTTNVNAVASTPLYLLDSGATSHCSQYCKDFSDIITIPTQEIRGINRSSISAIIMGTIHVKCRKGQGFTLKNALYIHDVKLHLVSICCLSDDGLKTSFNATTCEIHCGSMTIVKGS